MRPIDADAIPKEFLEYEFDGKWNGCTIKDLIDEQPTIQPEVLACGNGELVAKPEPTDEQIEEYCKRRCLHVVTDDFFESTKPQRLGHWIPQKGGGLRCSECGRYALDEPDGNFIHIAVPSDFCPHCGVKMKGTIK